MTDATALLRHPDQASPGFGLAGDVSSEGDEPAFDWAWLVPRLVHPIKVTIIEAMLWIERPISASELAKVFEGEINLGLTSYHMKELAKLGAIVKVGEQQVRGALQNFYSIPDRLSS